MTKYIIAGKEKNATHGYYVQASDIKKFNTLQEAQDEIEVQLTDTYNCDYEIIIVEVTR